MNYIDTNQRNWSVRKSGRPFGLDYGTTITDTRTNINFDELRQYRVKRAKDQMVKDGLGAVLMYEPWNVRYTTGFNVRTYARSETRYYSLLTRNGEPYLWATSGLFATSIEQMPWLPRGHVRLSRAPVDWVLREKQAYGGEFEKEILSILHEHGVEKEPLGLDSLAGGSVFALQEALQNVSVKLVDGRATMMEARKIKSREEIELMRISASIIEAGFAEARDIIRPGITEKEIVGAIFRKLVSMGAEWVEGFVCCSGENTNPNRLGFTDRMIRPGDMIFIDIIGSQFNGYRTCCYRDFTCGRATQEQKEIYQGAYEMQYAGMSAIKAGNTDLDIVNQWPEPEHWGYRPEELHEVRGNAVAHGLGLCQYDLPSITKSISKANPKKLEENMVIAIEVWEGKRGGLHGCRIEEECAVTKDGYDLLTKFPVKELTECWV